jgi:hypothetical protein
MVQAADFGELHDLPCHGELDRPDIRRILVEREVGPRLMVIDEIAGQETAEVSLAKDEHVVQAFTPDRADEPLGERVLPRALRRRENLLDAHAFHAVPKWLPVDAVAVAEQIDRRGLVREGVHDLLGGPGRGGMLGDVEVDDTPAVVSEHDENEEDAEASGGHGKEVDGDQVLDMVGEKRPPGLRGLGAPFGHEARDGTLGDVDAELQELAMNARGAPERIRGSHLPDEVGDVGVEGRAPSGWAAREPGPVLAKPAALPAQDSVGRDDDQRLPPPGPDSGQAGPEQTIRCAEPRAGCRSSPSTSERSSFRLIVAFALLSSGAW